ncbi:hypothetical protein NKI82_05580 [Mesorhizobium sp. M0482]|uniref:hypothetical protein n=1 Tax=Mesorhizobium sp. M0482 TaxID=2956948 RepID=UPI00333A8233
MANDIRTWRRRVVGAVVLIASVTASIAAFLSNVGSIRGFISGQYEAAELSIRDVNAQRAELTGDDPDDPAIADLISVSMIVEKNGSGSARNCTGLLYLNGSPVIESETEYRYKPKFYRDKFDVPEYARSIKAVLDFIVVRRQTLPIVVGYSFGIQCDGIALTETIELPSLAWP